MWPKCFLLLVMGVSLCMSPHPCEAADLQEAITQLQAWQKRIISIRLRSRETAEARSNVLLADSHLKTTLAEIDWIWEDSGRFRDSRRSYNDERFTGSSIRVADSRHVYIYDYPAQDPAREIPAQVTIHENTLRFTEMGLWAMPHWILWDNKTRTWLGDRLKDVTEAQITDAGSLQIDGQTVGTCTEGFTVTLDPQHGYLPQLAEHPGQGGQVCRYRVDEFRELEPGFWFPWKGSMLMNGNMLDSWEVTQVDLNTELPDSLFVPQLGDETYVVNSLTGKQYWHGGKPPAHLLAAKAAAANPGSTPVNINPLTGEPERPANWSLWLVLLGVVLVSVGVWVHRRT